MPLQLVECVPNFSEGRDMYVIEQITDAIRSVDGVKILHIDIGKSANRTVITFVGKPRMVVEAAFQGIQRATELIDMAKHKGAHPRLGATDVCPLVPITGIDLAETAKWARVLGKWVGEKLDMPVYLYEAAAMKPERKSLSYIRKGEYEGLAKKILLPDWQPDFGKAIFNPKAGAIVIGARNFLVAFNVNLNTKSVELANAIAEEIRESGYRTKGKGGEERKVLGKLKAVKAIGWFMEEYRSAQVSMNLTNLNITPIHVAYEEVRKAAQSRGFEVTGSELIGLIPLKPMLEAGRYYSIKQNLSINVSTDTLVDIAVKSMGMAELSSFLPQKRIIEYLLETGNYFIGNRYT